MLLLSLAAAAACVLSPANADTTFTVTVDGVARNADIVIGENAKKALLTKGKKVPVVYVWHGFGGKPKGMKRAFAPLLTDAIGVFPAGIGRTFPGFGKKPRPGWQISQHDLGGRDLKFFDGLHQQIVDTGCADETRVTSTGFSNGALFTNVLGCYRSNQLAAIAPVSGAGPGAEARCETPVPTLVVHGTKDRVLEFERGEKTAAKWAVVNQCEGTVKSPDAGSCSVMTGCKQPLQFCAHGRGHTAPITSRRAVVTFLLSHQRGQPAK